MFSFVLFIFCFLGDVAFSEYYVSLPFLFCMESTLCVFLPDGIFLPCHHGLDFDISFCEDSVKKLCERKEKIYSTAKK